MVDSLTQSTAPQSTPTMETKAERDLRSFFRSKTEQTESGLVISNKLAPVGEDRRKLTARRIYLSEFMAQQATDEQIRVRLARLFLRYPQTANTPLDQIAAMASAYIFDLRKFPLWAIDRGMMNLTSADIGHVSPQHPPSSLLVQQAVIKVLEPVIAEVAALSEVLDAAVYEQFPEEHRARMKSGFARILAELKAIPPEELPNMKRRPNTPSRYFDAVEARPKPQAYRTPEQMKMDAVERLAEIDPSQPAPRLSEAALNALDRV